MTRLTGILVALAVALPVDMCLCVHAGACGVSNACAAGPVKAEPPHGCCGEADPDLPVSEERPCACGGLRLAAAAEDPVEAVAPPELPSEGTPPLAPVRENAPSACPVRVRAARADESPPTGPPLFLLHASFLI